MSLFAILGYIVLLILVCIGLNGFHSFYIFFDCPSLLCTIVFFLLTLWGTGTMKDFINGIKIGLGKKTFYSMLELKKAEETLHLILKILLIFGSTCCLISFISVLYVMGLDQVGPMVALGLRSIFYALVIALFLTPFKGKIHMLLIAYAEENATKQDVLNEELLEQRVFYLFRSKGLTDREASKLT